MLIELKNAVKSKILFQTEDGVDIYKGDSFYIVNNKWEVRPEKTNVFGFKSFSTQKSAEEYIWKNKPCLSFKEIAPIIGRANRITYVDLDYITEKIKNLVKSKL